MDFRDPYARMMWHYESHQPLTITQIIDRGSVDTATAALLWLLVEHHVSIIVAGPTDPTPGVGKTTTLNSFLEFLPKGSTLAFIAGMWEDFSFLNITKPGKTCVLCNEVSDHLPIYAWGDVAAQLLSLPRQGYMIATSMHADTVDEALRILQEDLGCPVEDIQKLGVIINIGLVEKNGYLERRFLTVYYIMTDTEEPDKIKLLKLAEWNSEKDITELASEKPLSILAKHIGISTSDLQNELQNRRSSLQELVESRRLSPQALRKAVAKLRDSKK